MTERDGETVVPRFALALKLRAGEPAFVSPCTLIPPPARLCSAALRRPKQDAVYIALTFFLVVDEDVGPPSNR
jgi:hypothetical protein